METLTLGPAVASSMIAAGKTNIIEAARQAMATQRGTPLEETPAPWWISEDTDQTPDIEVALGPAKLVSSVTVEFVPRMEPSSFEVFLRLKNGDWRSIPWTQYVNGTEGRPINQATAAVPGGPDLYDTVYFKTIAKREPGNYIGIALLTVNGQDISKPDIPMTTNGTCTVYGYVDDPGATIVFERPSSESFEVRVRGIREIVHPEKGYWSVELERNLINPKYTMTVYGSFSQVLVRREVVLPAGRNSCKDTDLA